MSRQRTVEYRGAKMLSHLEIPSEFNLNTANIAALGAENTGQQLIELVMSETGRATLANVDILDVGCGVRFTQALINRAIPIGSYSGIDVNRPMVEFLKQSVEAKDQRFRFELWDVQNAMYNPAGELSLSELERLPVEGPFDLIWLFSVFTHLNALDAAAMLRLLRRHARPVASLFFSAFIDPDLEGFEDRIPETPLVNAYFGLETMSAMLERAGWAIESFHKQDYHLPIHERENPIPIVDYFVCSPS